MKIFYIFFVLLLFSCNRKPNDKGSFPDRIAIGFVINDDPSGTVAYRKIIANYLQKELGLKKIDLYSSTEYSAIIEAMKTKKVDIAFLGEFAYVLAHDKAGVEPMVMPAMVDGLLPAYSVIITYPGSGLSSMDDVKLKSHKLNLLFSSPSSTSGHLYPRQFLTSIGLDPEKSFKQVSFSSGHTATVFSVKNHQVDLACTMLWGINRLKRIGKIKENDLKILWVSGSYPGSPITIRRDLPDKFKAKVKQALLDLPKKDPKSWADFKNKGLLYFSEEERKKIIYVPACDSFYEPIRKIAKSIKNFNLE
jgi:phosphonate transport system substrate-binding protein